MAWRGYTAGRGALPVFRALSHGKGGKEGITPGTSSVFVPSDCWQSDSNPQHYGYALRNKRKGRGLIFLFVREEVCLYWAALQNKKSACHGEVRVECRVLALRMSFRLS